MPLTSLAAPVAVDAAVLRRSNLGLVLRAVRDGAPRSRARLASDLGLNKATVSSLVTELIDRGLVREGQVEHGAVGRPGRAVELDGSAVCGLGAEINVNHVAVMAVDLTGRTLHEERRSLDTTRMDSDAVLEVLASMIAEAEREAQRLGATPFACTVGVAGLVADATCVEVAPNLDLAGIDLVSGLQSLRDGDGTFTFTIDNEANLAAKAEAACRPQVDDMLVVFGEVGVGGGVIAGGHLQHGHRGFGGEIGHILVDPQGRRCGCGRFGCWESVIGLRALLDAAADPDDPVRDPELALEQRLTEIARRADLGDARTLRALEQIGDWFGVGAATLVNILNPEVIVLSGYFAGLGPWLLPAIQRRLDALVFAPDAGGTRVEFSDLGFTAAVRGAATAACADVFIDPTQVGRITDSVGDDHG